MIRLLLWAGAIAALLLLASAAWTSHRRRQHRRAIDAVLGWTRGAIKPGMELDEARAVLIGQSFFPLVEQGEDAILFAKELRDYPLLHPVGIRIRLTVDDQARVIAAEHQAVQAHG